jgi:hypothetical protein
MEDYRNRLVIITAGYPDEMEAFLNSNPGIKSRFAPPIHFKPFTVEELIQILINLAAAEGYVLADDAVLKASHLLGQVMEYQRDKFGYARTVRSVYEEIKGLMAQRVLSDTTSTLGHDDLTTITAADIPELSIPFDNEPMDVSRPSAETLPVQSLPRWLNKDVN